MAHQWLIRPEPFTKRKVLCGYPDCPGAADYAVSFPAQDPVLYCAEHAETSIHRATGQSVALAFVLEATRERNARIQRSRGRHVHWPWGGRVDGLSGGEVRTPRRDRCVCGAYQPVRFFATERGDVTCPRCLKRLARS